jgi:hypothetical protein
MRLLIKFYALICFIPLSIVASEEEYEPTAYEIEQKIKREREQVAPILNDILQGKITGAALNQPLMPDGSTPLGHILKPNKRLFDEQDDQLIRKILSDPLVDVNKPCARKQITTFADERISSAQEPEVPPLLLIGNWLDPVRRLDTLRLLLKRGANSNVQDPVYLNTAAHLVVGGMGIMTLFPPRDQKTKLPMALELLKEHGANFNLQNSCGYTPLHTAVTVAGQLGNLFFVHQLLMLGADATIPNCENKTPAHIYQCDQNELSEFRKQRSDRIATVFQIHATLRPDKNATAQDYARYKTFADAWYALVDDMYGDAQPLLALLSDPKQKQFFVSKVKDRAVLQSTQRLLKNQVEQRDRWGTPEQELLRRLEQISAELS